VSPSVGIGALLIEGVMSKQAGEPTSNSILPFAKSDDDSSSPAPMREETNEGGSPGGHAFAHPLKQAIQRTIEDLVLLDHPQVPAIRYPNRFCIRE
jgi:hypothetical protein